LILPKPIREARPRPVLCASHQVRIERAPFNEPAHVQQSIGRCDRFDFEAIFVNGRVAERWTDEPNADRVGSCYPLHKPREEPRSRGASDEMPVVIHHAVGLHGDRIPLQALAENQQEVAIILGSQKERRAAVAAVDNMKVPFRVETTIVSQHGWVPATSNLGAGHRLGGW